jgi:tetratricopeptide (TPR) repeat protein
MRLSFFLPVALVCLLVQSIAYGQKVVADTVEVPKAGFNAQADSIYFDVVKAKMRNDSKLAKELLEAFIVRKPDVSDGYYELSKIYYNNKNLDKAEEQIKKAISLQPGNKWYKEQYASILAEKGSYNDAANIVSELVKSQPQDITYPLMAADYYEKAKKYNEAITYLDVALVKRGGQDEDIMMRKMQVYLQMNNVEKATGVIEQMLVKEPRNGRYYKLLGDLYDNNKMPAKAAAVYERGQKLIPGDPSIQLGLAEHYMKTGDTASYTAYVKKVIVNNELDAETQLELLSAYIQSLPNDSLLRVQGLPIIRQIRAQHPLDPQVLELYAGFLEITNQHDSAVIMYKKALEIKPSNFKVWEKLLSTYTSRAEADSLIKYSEKAMRLFPNQASASYYNGIGYFNKKAYPQAIKAINRAIDMEPEDEKAVLATMYELLGEIYNSTRQYDLSDESYDKALKLTPNDAGILNNYSYYLSVRGKKLDEAEKMSKRSLELRPNEATYIDTYGWILYKKGNYEKAREYIQKAVDQAGNRADATLYDHLGNVYFKLNNKQKALQYWKLAKEKGGDDPLIDKKISEEKLYE